MTRRRRPAGSPPAALEDDDLLRKIFLLLPPQPSTLPRISFVCKQWRGVVTDPRFLRGFREHHRKPPVLGLVMGYNGEPFFRSNLSSPDLIPHDHFFPPDILNLYMELFGCRHGRVLFFDRRMLEIMVWDPATGDRRSVAVPLLFDDKEIVVYNGAVLCAAARGEGHVHGDCHSSPFQVILIGVHSEDRAFPSIYSSVYSSETRAWGDIISTLGIHNTGMDVFSGINSPATLVGSSLYWVFAWYEDGILKFDLDRQILVCIEMPDFMRYRSGSSQIMPTDDCTSSVRLALLEYQEFEMWERKVDCDDVAGCGWVLHKTFQMNMIIGIGPMGGGENLILGYDDEDHVIYVRTEIGVCMIQLDTMEFKNLGKDNFTTTSYYPYRSFYTAVRDLSVCEKRVCCISKPLAIDGNNMAPASRGVGVVGGNAAAASSGTRMKGATFDKSKHSPQVLDADLVPSRVLTQTRIDVIFKKEMESISKLSKAWAKWFRSNGVPESKADCPHFHAAMKLTQQLGTRLPVPAGKELGSVNLEVNEEELP